MSHVILDLDLEIDNLDTLAKACTAMGCEFHHNKQTIRWFNKFLADYHGADAAYRHIDAKTFGQCSHAIVVPGAGYDIGIVPHPNNPKRWAIYFDNYCGGKGIEAKLGKGAGLLKKQYGIERSKKELRREGWRARELKRENGIRLVFTR